MSQRALVLEEAAGHYSPRDPGTEGTAAIWTITQMAGHSLNTAGNLSAGTFRFRPPALGKGLCLAGRKGACSERLSMCFQFPLRREIWVRKEIISMRAKSEEALGFSSSSHRAER